MSVLAVYRPPFELKPEVRHMPAGQSLADMRAAMPGLPADFDAFGVICINGVPVPTNAWGLIKPKPAANGVPVEVTFHAAIRSGGSSDGKSVLAVVASIALTAGAGFILSGGLASGALFAKGSLSAAALAAGVSVAGSLILSGLVSPPTFSAPQTRDPSLDTPGSAGAEANVLEPNGPIQRVIGTHRVTPRLACEALTYYDGDDELVEAVYCLAGPHQLADIRLADAPIASIQDLELETREGWPGDAPLSIVTRHGRTENLQIEMRGHAVSDLNGTVLDSQSGSLTDALPLPSLLGTRAAPDEFWIDVALPSGLHLNASETNRLRVPFRLRIREVGQDNWINLPELHFQAARLNNARATIKLQWSDNAATTPSAAVNEGWVEARHTSPGQAVDPAGPDRFADPYFVAAGAVFMNQGNLGTTGVDHVELDRHVALFRLDTAVFPKGRYEVEIVRGYAFRNAQYGAGGYTINGVVRDPFRYQNSGTPQIFQTKDGVADTVYLLRAASVWNEPPTTTDDCALIAVRARNKRIDRLNVLASGYVRDWDGSAWADWVTTSNPAPHFRDVMAGLLNMKPVPGEIIDDTGLVEWRTICAAQGLECNMVALGQSVSDILRIVAACGYARDYMSEVWGVARDYDRSEEGPVQIFTPANSAGFSYTKGFSDLPDGIRVTFADRENNYQTTQITQFRDGVSDDSGLVEQVSFQGFVTEAGVRRKALYDLRQADWRSTFYSLDVPAEAIVCRKGSLVGVQHDMVTDLAGQGRVLDTIAGVPGFLAGIVIDDFVDVWGEMDVLGTADILAVPDMLKLGVRTGVVIRRADGTITTHALQSVTETTQTLMFETEIPAAGIKVGTLVSVGGLSVEFLRLIVFGITPGEDLTATLTLVDEAPEIWA